MKNEMKIGEILPFGFKKIKCVELEGTLNCDSCCSRNAEECSFLERIVGHCDASEREDGKNVIFPIVNDVDIWEGDLLNVVIHYGQEVQYLAQVVWSGFFPSFAMLLQNNTEESDWIKCGLMEYKVVGNIYDNPEMLNKNYNITN